MRTSYRKWSAHPYQGESAPPKGSKEASYGPMFFISRGRVHEFINPFQQPINWRIKNPIEIDWGAELLTVEHTLKTITPEQIQIAKYWGTGEITSKISNLVYSLAQKYKIGSPSTSRVQGYFHAAMNDVFVITWYLKYLWDVARPNQYNRNLPTVLATPRFPGYPSAHASLAGCAEVILSYFFSQEAEKINRLMEESALSRLYAGVHFKVDNDEGLKIGRQIAEMVVALMRVQNLKTY